MGKKGIVGKNKDIGDTIVFFHAGSETVGTVTEKDPAGYSTKYLYRVLGKDGTKYLIKPDDLMVEEN